MCRRVNPRLSNLMRLFGPAATVEHCHTYRRQRGTEKRKTLCEKKEEKTIGNIRSSVISWRARSGGGGCSSGLQGLLSAACLLISLPRGLAWPRKLISGACNTSHPLCWPVQRPTLAATCSPNTNTQAPLWPWPCPAAPTQCTHFGMVHYWKPTVSCAWVRRHTCV